MIRRSVLCAALVAAGLLAASCDVTVHGQARPNSAVAHAVAMPLNTRDAFGDAPTMDPCSIIDIPAMPADMHVVPEPDDSFDDCRIRAKLADGTVVYAYAGPLETVLDENSAPRKQVATLGRGMRVDTSDARLPGQCSYHLIFPDELRLVISSITADASSTANTCPVSDALARNAAAAIVAGSARHVTFGKGSVGGVNPCGLVSPALLTSINLLAGAPLPYPQQHECRWVSGQPDGMTLLVAFVFREPPVSFARPSDSITKIDGRTTVTFPTTSARGRPARCDVEAGLTPYGTGGTGLLEVAVVETTATDTTEACAAGQAIAAAVWPKLPRSG